MGTNSTAPSGPQTTDAFAAALVDVISGLANNLAAPAIDAAAEADAPILAVPVIKQIFEAIVGELVGELTINLEGPILRVVFTIQESSKIYALGKAAVALQQAQASGDPNAISTATQNEIDQWSNLIHWGGTAPVQS